MDVRVTAKRKNLSSPGLLVLGLCSQGREFPVPSIGERITFARYHRHFRFGRGLALPLSSLNDLLFALSPCLTQHRSLIIIHPSPRRSLLAAYFLSLVHPSLSLQLNASITTTSLRSRPSSQIHPEASPSALHEPRWDSVRVEASKLSDSKGLTATQGDMGSWSMQGAP